MNFCIFGRIHLFRMISLLFALRQRACTMYVSEPEISVCSSAYTGLVGTAARFPSNGFSSVVQTLSLRRPLTSILPTFLLRTGTPP